ncbi:hypothetical protein DPEC_G00266580 [Dallia pectoralis]|uniref:Uncharacterized protein n=1 Tax=Dallia pectoralis TaxID=75939 RepID=A0ACC2FND2_DALPE|nr:hypothetical protein DPEC_G00266580 [Dallia pectoralis]
MVPLSLLILFFIHWPSGCNSLWTLTRSTIRTGGNITVPCHYHRMFKDNVKYWCKGRYWSLCTVMASTNTKLRKGGVLITDSPEELVFTVTMQNLQVTDTNRYWCALKVDGKLDVKVYLDLKVSKALPDLSAVNEEVSGEEQASIHIQCVYGDSLRDKAKQWCRSGDRHSCLTQTETSQNASVVIKDDQTRMFNVTLRRLEGKDAGWYWCSVGDLQAPVHITVNQRTTTHRNRPVTPPTPSIIHSSYSSTESSTTTFSSMTSPSSTGVTAPTTTYPNISIPYITIRPSTVMGPLSTTQNSKESKTAVIHQNYNDRNVPWHIYLVVVLVTALVVIFVMAAVNIYRSSRNNARPMEEEMAELVNQQ